MEKEINYKFSSETTGTHVLLVGYIDPKTKVLDIGCAGGYLGGKLVSEKQCEVWGIEPDPQSYAEAQDKGYKMIFNKKVEEALAGIPDEKFDYILLGDVLEHLEKPEDVLLSLHKVLKNEGCLVVSLPNVAHYSVRLSLLFGRWKMTESGILDKTHLHFYTLQSAGELFKQTGWKVTEVRPRGDLERLARKVGLEWLGKQLLFLWSTFFAVQFIFIVKKEKYD